MPRRGAMPAFVGRGHLAGAAAPHAEGLLAVRGVPDFEHDGRAPEERDEFGEVFLLGRAHGGPPRLLGPARPPDGRRVQRGKEGVRPVLLLPRGDRLAGPAL
eukprot:5502933-Lingulodinium_polyedra.AAC.1